jgi:hypothetical protein
MRTVSKCPYVLRYGLFRMKTVSKCPYVLRYGLSG